MADGNNEYYYSEIFHSFQGEGNYVGAPSVWLRYFLCNLQCNGFGQKDPTDPGSYVLPYKDLDTSNFKTIEDLPVFKYGCDSSYSWAKKFKHMQRKGTPEQIAERLQDLMKNEHNPEGKFVHPATGNITHLVFTGGEPLMKHAQKCTAQVVETLKSKHNNPPQFITFETNGTQELTKDFVFYFSNLDKYRGELFFSISPKLFTVTGERPEDAIDVDNWQKYYCLSSKGQFKFVVNGTQQCWYELESIVKTIRLRGINYPIWVMPVGGDLDGQQGAIPGHMSAAEIADEGMRRGYKIAPRVHVYVYGNVIGK